MDLITPELGLLLWALFVLLILVSPVLALISILKNKFNNNEKLIWVLVVILLPFVGSLLYFIIGRSKRLIINA
ncbi:PLD nuclease N-terminal domain-containing protein [Winogradskyella sp. UBA3174]|uniref:PLD nuclease N-terminal domain-containing protein n=1 Tax=Winogradskyella sp. UBA3174 TaxID=1947785 RepID=UPI0025EAC0EA|nr:PLD nuclease N-terminal domain-containing protein [Winogradskyella sp. UBA3174]|tara:strand:- start:57 stop:275 length:219 start_codon:yes stop_codon:yes gene_type:complete